MGISRRALLRGGGPSRSATGRTDCWKNRLLKERARLLSARSPPSRSCRSTPTVRSRHRAGEGRSEGEAPRSHSRARTRRSTGRSAGADEKLPEGLVVVAFHEGPASVEVRIESVRREEGMEVWMWGLGHGSIPSAQPTLIRLACASLIRPACARWRPGRGLRPEFFPAP